MVHYKQPPSLILHADDFGLNAAVTEGIIQAFGAGLLTSTSLLANAPAAQLALERWRWLEAARRSGDLPSNAARHRLGDPGAPFDLGIHLNLTQGVPLTAGEFPVELVDLSGSCLGPGRLYRRLCANGRRWAGAIRDELQAQVNWLLDRGVTPTHVNGHQYVEMMPVVSDIIANLAQQHRVPYVRAAVEPGHWRTSLLPDLRLTNWCLSHVKQHYARRWAAVLDRSGLTHADAFFGASHAGRIDLGMMRQFVRLARQHAVTEIAFHPGRASPGPVQHDLGTGWHDPLAVARPCELALLCSPELADLLATSAFQLGRISAATSRQVCRTGVDRRRTISAEFCDRF